MLKNLIINAFALTHYIVDPSALGIVMFNVVQNSSGVSAP